MLRRMSVTVVVPVLLIALFSLGTAAAAGAPTAEGAQHPPAAAGSREALLEALTWVPDAPDARASMLSYLDQEALVVARPGAAQPGSIAEAFALMETDDLGGRLWLAAFMGASSGDAELVLELAGAGDWPSRLGFDLLDVGRHLTFGEPPSEGTVLIGAFDPTTITTAFSGRGFRASEAGRLTLLCAAAGCEAGMSVDLANADGSLPFGAQLGRREPLAVSDRALLSSADIDTVAAMLATSDGEAASLADDPSYRALALAVDPTVALTQATLLPAGILDSGPDIARLLAASPGVAADLVVEPDDSLAPLPAARAVAIIDGATATEQVVTIALAYAEASDAVTATEILPQRLANLPAVSYERPLAELLADRGVTSVSASVVPAAEGRDAVARVELRAPLAGPEPDPEIGSLEPSSRVYQLLVSLVLRRDLLWLVPDPPLD